MIPKKRFKPKKLLFILLIPLGMLLTQMASNSPALIERYYSGGLYRYIGQGLSRLIGVLPFSLAEILIIITIILILTILVRMIVKIFRRDRERRYFVLNSTANLLIFASVMYFIFILIWGLNYHRQPFSTIAGFDIKPATMEELVETTDYIISKANELRSKVSQNNEGVMKLESLREEVLKRADRGYTNIADIYSELSGKYGRPKGVMLSELMSYTEIWGVYFPFTGEANVNMKIPESSLPSTVCHEMAHQRGFAREDEANFISYIVCNAHPDVDFQYSGTMSALSNLLNAVAGSNRDEYSRLYEKLSDGIKRDFAAINQFSEKYEGVVGDISSNINDIYLKSNKQQDGVRSYGRMVDLLIAEHRARQLEKESL